MLLEKRIETNTQVGESIKIYYVFISVTIEGTTLFFIYVLPPVLYYNPGPGVD